MYYRSLSLGICHLEGGIFNSEKSKLISVDRKEHGRVRNKPGGNIYGKLWEETNVYCDEPYYDGKNDLAFQ
jgi:hypothetical protein